MNEKDPLLPTSREATPAVASGTLARPTATPTLQCTPGARRVRWANLAVGAAVLLLVGVAFDAMHVRNDEDEPESMTSTSAAKPAMASFEAGNSEDGRALSVRASSEYIDRLGPIAADYPWVDDTTWVVDVYKPFTLHADQLQEGCTAAWTVGDAEKWGFDAQQSYTEGQSLSALLNDPGIYTVHVKQVCSTRSAESAHVRDQGSSKPTVDVSASNRERQAVEIKVVAIHVRRELRELTEADTAALMDAMEIMFKTKTTEGRKLYGELYCGVDKFQEWHHLNSAQRDSDHFHQGIGFLAQHAKVSKMFEESLQTINPALTLPYWDSTIESTQVANGEIRHVWETDLWTPALFGSIRNFMDDIANMTHEDMNAALFSSPSDWAIPDGRFAMFRSPTPSDEELGYAMPRNAYGFLRAPWNNNPTPYVSRYPSKMAQFPTCKDHWAYAWGDSSNWTSNTWMQGVETGPHAGMHSSPGGMLNVYDSTALAELPMLNPYIIDSIKQHTLWRFHVLEFPTTCSTSEPAFMCRPRCNTNLYTLHEVGYEIYKAQESLPSAEDLNALTQSDYEAIGEAYCRNPPVFLSGDAKDSGGCVDPSFWPIHGALERIYQYRLIRGDQEARLWSANSETPRFKVYTDPSEAYETKGPRCWGGRSFDRDPTHLCFVQDDSVEAGFRASNLESECCAGHFGDSRLFKTYPSEVEGMTNEETLAMIDPRAGPNFHYGVYHHLRWDHCTSVGITFPSLAAFQG